MDIFLASKIAKELMEKHGVTAMGYKFRFNNRRRAAGTCKWGYKTIELSLPITTHANEADVTDTILHEIAHALAGADAGHGWKWVQIARSIGCKGNRCFDERTKPSTTEAYKLVAKYKAVCVNGHEHFANRAKKKKSSCGRCSSRFDERFVLNFQRVN